MKRYIKLLESACRRQRFSVLELYEMAEHLTEHLNCEKLTCVTSAINHTRSFIEGRRQGFI